MAGVSVRPRLALAELEVAIDETFMALYCPTGIVVIAEMKEAGAMFPARETRALPGRGCRTQLQRRGFRRAGRVDARLLLPRVIRSSFQAEANQGRMCD